MVVNEADQNHGLRGPYILNRKKGDKQVNSKCDRK